MNPLLELLYDKNSIDRKDILCIEKTLVDRENDLENIEILRSSDQYIESTVDTSFVFLCPEPIDNAAKEQLRTCDVFQEQRLLQTANMLEEEIGQKELLLEKYSVAEIEDFNKKYIKKLHQYNELKDCGQLFLGKIAQIKGVTTKEIYSEFNLSPED